MLSICTGALLAGCGGSQPPIAAPGAALQRRTFAPPLRSAQHIAKSSYQTLFGFSGSTGEYPMAGLIDVNGTLYGTTYAGGSYGLGTVFSITADGTEHVLHSFSSLPDGRWPEAGLIDVKGTLYGTTSGGGAYYPYGTVFSISTDGTEHVLHSFGNGSDGTSPSAGLIDVKGTFYGTALGGGAHGHGTVFSITKAGEEKTLYSFGGGSDGEGPAAGLIDVDGTLYGTTYAGGGSGNCEYGCGTVFSVTTNGDEHVLHSFTGNPDGSAPSASLVDVDGTLYGTTARGGKIDDGVIFSVTTNGTENVLHSFGRSAGGAYPEAGLIPVKRALYGTGAGGGKYFLGTIFRMHSDDAVDVLHSFGSTFDDGEIPEASLIYVKGEFYGTTYEGGPYNVGTVFAFKP
jgi:uncharacterized repeat protein (TIGR03803 family)